MKKPKMTVVGGRGFDEIVRELSGHIAQAVNQYGLSQKMATRLVHEAWAHVEQEQVFRGDPESYVREHLDGQIKDYIRLGVHTLTGLTETEFTSSFAPLVQKTVSFFLPPAGHPIVDGEFTCFLVVPEAWGLSLRTLFGKLRPPHSAGLRELLDRAQGNEVVQGGHAASPNPYVLVGVKGERGFRDCTRAVADKEREKFNLTYFSAYQLALLLLLRPRLLSPGERVIALGEEFPGGRYLQFDAFVDGFMPAFVRDPSPSSLDGTGKPYYARMITL